ncbi:MAG: hypothetical protein J7K64_07100 [Bacteroidales bacterium]|nr:hypothetical protein [Bacteroidales bacterium]
MSDTKTVIIGAGNVATNLAFAFQKAGIKKLHIHNRTKKFKEENA